MLFATSALKAYGKGAGRDKDSRVVSSRGGAVRKAAIHMDTSGQLLGEMRSIQLRPALFSGAMKLGSVAHGQVALCHKAKWHKVYIYVSSRYKKWVGGL